MIVLRHRNQTCWVKAISLSFAHRFFFEIVENAQTSHITVREHIFQEAERQFFGSINVFLSPAVWVLVSGKFTKFPLLGLKYTPIMGHTDITELKKRKEKKVPKPVSLKSCKCR